MTLALVPKPPTDQEFLVVFNRLAVALQAPQDESGITQGVYFDALKDLPMPALDAGALTLMREGGRRFFPSTAEWREAAQAAQRTQLREAVRPSRAEPWHHECASCGDTGWQPRTCDGSDVCGRHKQHAAHDYVSVCPCRPTNRTYQRNQHFGAGE